MPRQAYSAARRQRQRGMSLIGVVLLGVVIVAIAAIVFQSVPVFVEHFAIVKAINRAGSTENSVEGARSAFERAADIENIHSLKGNDLKITPSGDRVVIKYSYQREIALAGPAYLVYRFEGQSKPPRRNAR